MNFTSFTAISGNSFASRDRDDIISEFFVPCLANCIEYSRCVERISAKSLTTIILAIGDDPDTRVRIVSGHRFGAGDIALMNKIFSKDGNRIVNDFIRDTKINRLRQAVNGKYLPNVLGYSQTRQETWSLLLVRLHILLTCRIKTLNQ